MKFDTIIFDLDGTLIDTLDDLMDSVNYALDKFGFPSRNLDEIRSFVGNGVKRLVYLSVPDGTDEATSEKCLEIFKEHYKGNSKNKTAPYDGIQEMLEGVKKAGFKTAVVTNKIQDAAIEIITDFFGDKIDVIIGQIDGVAQKPEPDGVWLALEKLGVSKENAVYVGDSEVDCMTAHNAGIPCVGVTWGFRDRSVLEEHKAEFIIDKPEELFEVLN
jgi:phosphoglycolate phosphatase